MANKRKTVTTPEGPGGPGGQELPGNNFMDAICGALGALAYGDSAIKNQSDLMGAVGQQSKLYSILESLNKNNKGEDKNKLVSVETSTFMKDMGQVMKNNITDPIGEHFLTINENLLNTGNQIRDFIENYDYVTNIFDNINNTLSCIEEGLRDRENLPEVKIYSQITGSNDLPELIDSIKNVDSEELKNIYKNINEAIQLLNNADVIKAKESLASIDEILDSTVKIGKFLKDKDKIDDLNVKIRDIKSILKNNIGDLFTALNGLAQDNNNVNESTIALAQLLGSLITVISIDQSKVSAKGIKILRNLLRKDGPIDGIFIELKRLNEDAPKVTNDITAIFKIISSFQNLGKIGYFAAINVRRGLRILSDFIKSEFKEIYTAISVSAKEAEKKKEIDIQTLIDTIDLITKIGETKVNIREVRRRMYRISDVISKSVSILFNAINELSIVANAGVQNTNAIISSIDSILSIITSINDIKESVIENAGDKINDIAELFEISETGEIHNLIANLSVLTPICENVDANMYKITDVFDSISVLFSTIPGFGELLKTSFKLELLSESVESINDMIVGNKEEKITGISNIKVNNQEIHKVITAVNNIINFINSTNENLSEDGLNELIKKNHQIIKLLNIINNEFILIGTIEPVDEDKLKSIEEVILNFSEFGPIGTAINTINDDSLTKINTLLEIIKSLSSSLLYVNDIKKLKIKESDLDSAVEAINQINIITNLITDSVSKDQADKIKNKSAEICALCDIFKAIAIINKVGKAAKPGLALLESSAKKINDIIGIFNEIDINKVNAATQMMNAFAKLMIISAAVLIVGALAMTFVDAGNLMTFGITLGAFMFLLTKSISNLGKEIKNSFNIIEDFSRLVVASAAVLILGGLIMSAIDTGNLLAFTLTLAGFITAVTAPIFLFNKTGKNAMKGMKEFTIFVVASAAVLLLGSMLMDHIDKLNLVTFATILAGFIWGITKAVSSNSKGIRQAAKPLLMMMGVVVASAAVLLLGSWAMGEIDPINVGLFTIILGGFMLGMVGMLKIVNKASKDIFIGIAALGAMTIIVGLSAGALMLVGKVMRENDLGSLLGGVGIIALVIVGIAGIAMGLGAIVTSGIGGAILWAGIGAMAAVAGIAVMAGVALLAIGNAMKIMAEIGPFDAGAMIGNISAILGLGAALAPIGALAGLIIPASIAITMMSTMMAKIAQTVKDYAELKIPLYEGTKIVGYRHLEKNDFETAAENVKCIITTLGQAVIDVYDMNPEIFESGKFTIVTYSLKTLGPMISRIAQGVKDYADLKVAISWDKEGNATKYRHLSSGDFDAASENVKKVIITLANAVIAVYDENPKMFADGDDSTFNIVTKSCMKLGKLISKIAAGVKDYAELKVPIAWDKEGKATNFRSLSKVDFENAGENVKKVITTLAQAVVSVYDASPELFDDGDDSTFNVVMESCKDLGKMLSKIASSVQDYANLTVPIEWNNEGKAIKFRSLKSSDFENAAENVKKVITTLAQAVVSVYNASPDLFDDGEDSTFNVVMESCKDLGKMLSKIADGIQDYANLTIPIKWNAEGKAVEFRTLTKDDFDAASENVKKVITTLAQAVVSVYNSSPNLFEDGEDSTFNIVMDSCKDLGKMLSKIADGVQSYANLTIPIEWNKDGKAIKFRQMKDDEVIKAGTNIKKIITTLGSAIIQTYDSAPDMFATPDDGSSKFNIVMQSVSGLGKLMSEIAQGVQSYANLLVPIEWNKDGKAIKFRSMEEKEITKAGENIKKIILTMSSAIMQTYDGNPDMFAIPKMGGSSKFDIVMSSVMGLGKLMSEISQGVQSYANLLVPIEWNADGKAIKFRSMEEKEITKAGENIKKVIVTMASAIVETYDMKPELFAQPTGLLGFGKGESKFDIVSRSLMAMGKLMSSIAVGLQSYANLLIPTKWNDEGKAIEFKQMANKDITKAGENIKKVIITMAEAIVETYDMKPELFAQPTDIFGFGKGDSKFDRVTKSVTALGKLMSEICTGVQSYANLVYPTKWNADGKAIEFKSMKSSDVTKAGENIKEVIVTMAEAIVETYDMNPELFAEPTGLNAVFGDGKSKFDKIVKSVSALGKLMSDICAGVQSYANLVYPIEWNSDGKAIKYKSMKSSDITKAGENIKEVIIAMSSAIIETYEMNPDMFAQPTGLFGFGKGDSKFDKVMKSVSALGKLMGDICAGVQSYANLVYPIEWNAEGKAIKYKSMKSSDIVKAGENIKEVIITMSSAIIETYDMNPDMFAQPTGLFGFGKGDSKFDKVMKSVSALGKLMGEICTGVQSYANLSYPVEWNKDGKVIKYKSMSSSDITKAAETIKQVILTMSSAIFETYDENPDMFEEPSASGLAGLFGKKDSSKFTKVMGTIGGLGILMKDLCTSLQAYANLSYPVKWNSEGQAIDFKRLGDDGVKSAAEALKEVIITMSRSIFEVYDENPDMFEEPKASGLAGLFGKKDSSKFSKVMGTIGGLGILMKDICTSLQAYANLSYPIKWNAEGQAIDFKRLGDDGVKSAAKSLKEVIITMSRAIFEVYDENPDMFEEPKASGLAGLFGKKDSSKFSKVMGTIGGLGILMKDICTSLQAYANLQYPIKWNEEGQAIDFDKVDVVKAGENIQVVIKTLSQAIFDVYDKNPEMFEEPSSGGVMGFFGKKEKSKFARVMGSIGGLGALVLDISKALQNYANMRIPSDWNSEGIAINYLTIDNAVLQNVGTNIGTVITTLAQALVDTYNAHPDMFEEPSAKGLGGFLGKKEKSKIGKIMSSIAGLGNLVAGVGQGIKDFATMQYAIDWNADGNPIKYVKVGDAEFKAAAQNIGTVITVIGNALIDIYRKSPGGMFDDEVVKTGFIIKRAKKLEGTSPMAKTIKALGGMGELVAGLAGGVKDFATMQYPDQWDDQGNPIHYVKLTSAEQRAAIENIGYTITTVGNALISVYRGKSWKDMIMAKDYVVPMINNISGSIGRIAIGVRQFAINQVPTWYDKDGKPMDPVSVDYKAAADTVGMVITTIGKALVGVAEGAYGWDIKQAVDVSKSILNISKGIIPIALGLRMFAMEEIPLAYDKDGKPTQMQKIDFNKAAQTAANVMGVLAKTIIDIYQGNSRRYGIFGFVLSDFEMANKKVMPLLLNIGETISPIAQSLYLYGRSEIPVRWDKDGNPTEFKSIDYEAAAQTAANVMGVLAKTIINIYNGEGMNKGRYYFALSDFENANKKVIPLIKSISETLSPLAKSLYLYGRSEVPIRWDKDGNPTQYKKINYEAAAQTAANVMGVLAKTIINIYNGEGMNKGQYGFALSDFENANKKVIPLIKSISETLSPLAKSLYFYGRSEVPIRFDKDGNPTQYKKVDYAQAAITASTVLNVLPNAVVEIAKGATMQDLTEAMIFIPPILEKIRKILGPLAGSLYLYGVQQVPIKYDADGNPTEFKKVDFAQAGITAGLVMTSILDPIGAVIDKYDWNLYNSKAEVMFKVLRTIIRDAGKLAKSLYLYGIEQVPIRLDDEGNTIESKEVDFIKAGVVLGTVFETLATSMKNSIKLMNWDYYEEESIGMFKVINHLIRQSGKLAGVLTLYANNQIPVKVDNDGNVIESKEVDFVQAGVVLGSVFETLATSMKNSIKLMNWDYYEEESDSMFKGLNKYIANIGKLGNVLKWYSLRQIPLAVDKNGNPTGLIEFNPEKAVQTATDVVTYLAKSFDKIIADHSKTFEKMNELKLFDTLVNLANKLLKTSIILSKVLPVNENTNNLLQALYGHTTMLNNIFDKNTVIDYSEWLIKTNTFDSIIKILSRSYSYITDITEEPFDILAEGLDKINEKIAEMPSQNIFRQHEQILSKYVKSINKIDIKKVNSLTNLINSMNILGYKMGNLDNLTKVLAEQISTVLKKLTEQLAKAAATIKDAEKLQKFREDSIKKSISEISGLLGQTMKVEISQSSGDTQTTPGSPGAGPTQDGETQQGGTELSLTTPDENEDKTKKEGNTGMVGGGNESRLKSDQRRVRNDRITLSGYVILDNKGKQIGKIAKN